MSNALAHGGTNLIMVVLLLAIMMTLLPVLVIIIMITIIIITMQVKRDLLRRISRVVDRDVVIASSSLRLPLEKVSLLHLDQLIIVLIIAVIIVNFVLIIAVILVTIIIATFVLIISVILVTFSPCILSALERKTRSSFL